MSKGEPLNLARTPPLPAEVGNGGEPTNAQSAWQAVFNLLAKFNASLNGLASRMNAIEINNKAPAKDGVGISEALIDNDGRLVLALTDGRTLNLGRVVGKDGETPELPKFDPPAPGKDGRSITDVKVDDRGHLVLSFNDGDKIDVGMVAKEGKPGESIKGDRGIGIQTAKIVNNELVLIYTNGIQQTVGRVVGKDGESTRAIAPKGVPEIEISESYSADIDARELKNLRLRDLTVDGQTFQVLCRN
jgi:hypothetical protein